ncbi:MAG TPA: permease prefix domain 1-containing protein [Verrucomicrobiae bacterium]|jgi:hypothetical protein
MFHLESAIANWREQMLAAGVSSPVPLEELEIHLREEIERQRKAGLSTEQAFGIAVQNIGVPEAIQKEYKKLGWFNSQNLVVFRPYAFVISFVLGALLSTPEVIIQILTFALFVFAYEVEIRTLRRLEQRATSPARQIGICLALGALLATGILKLTGKSLIARMSQTTHQNGHTMVDNWSQPQWYAWAVLGLFLIGLILTILPKPKTSEAR